MFGDQIHAYGFSFDDFSEYYVFAVKVGGISDGNKKLRAVGVRSGISL